ncbi:ABC transporter ATP-binding protein [Bacteriovorax sp. Seq25_V]|uniref:ABC transporter ATP-binding protein n=1 Tax=Bacteriovorax sp. Seq25_V TaxID=1201288 RepID=UPI0004013668|nr:ABC transporter ATP-binding protein [Bacteriovorax sp. Seq25_V]
MFGSISLSLILAGIGALQVRLVQPIFDNGIDPNSSVKDIYFLAGSLLVLGIINFPCRFFHFYWIRFVVDRATCAIREDLFQKLQRLPTAFFTENKQGEMISTIVNDTHVFSNGFKAIIDLLREPLKAAAYLGMAFYYDWQLTLVIFLIAPFLVLIFNISGKKVKNNQGAVQREYADLTHNIAEGIGGQKLTKAFNLQDYVVGRFRKAQDKYFDSQMRTTFVEEFAHPLVEVVSSVAFSAVIIFAYYRVVNAGLTKGTFIGFIAALALFMDPIRKFSQANVRLSQARAAAERIFQLLALSEERDDGSIEKVDFKESIEVKGLSFAYGNNKVIDNLTLSIPKGKKIALVGLSGSGKSTLINLLLGLYPIEKNKIFIDGKDITDMKLGALRDLFGLVSQDIFLFHDTISENLTLGKEFKEEQIQSALEVSYASEFVNTLEEKEFTLVGDRGSRLSGGQQQRITIARAFLQNTDVLLFDEATSALDNESEKVVQKALESIAETKTVVAVAHRLSTIQNYDMIYVMKEGRVVESGHHAELMAHDGEYRKLYALSLG